MMIFQEKNIIFKYSIELAGKLLHDKITCRRIHESDLISAWSKTSHVINLRIYISRSVTIDSQGQD